MMAASECTHVAEEKPEDENDQESNETQVVELSSIEEPATPPDVIVQRQIREVIQLQNAAVEHLYESVAGQESFIREHVVSKEEHFTKLKEMEQSMNTHFISREEYDALAEKLEQEQLQHAETKLKLMEVTDKLDFTLGEVEILSKQLSKEKDTFQQIVDSLRSQIAKGSNWNEELDGKYSVSQKVCQELQARLESREATIQSLEQRLAAQQKQCERKIEEIEVERQQDQYVQRMLEQDKNGRLKKSSTKTTNIGFNVKR